MKLTAVLFLGGLSLGFLSACENKHEARHRAVEDSLKQADTRSEQTLGPKAKGYRFYVENSGSMLGYFEGNAEFKTALLDLGSRLKSQKIDFFYITDKAYTIDGAYEGFVQQLDKTHASKVGKQASSEIAQIVQTALAESLDKGQAAIVASDFIFSIKGQNPLDELGRQKFIIKSELEKLKTKGYGLLILQMESAFNGKYFNYKNQPKNFQGQRPYYLWVMAPISTLNSFMSDFQAQTLKGFKQFLILYDSEQLAKPYASLLPQSQKVGQFSRPRKLKAEEPVLSLEGFALDKRKEKAQFCLALDLSHVPIQKKDLLNKDLYLIENQGDLELELESVVEVGDFAVHQNDKRYLGSATHVLVFEAEGKMGIDPVEVKVHIKKSLPDWIKRLSTEDDLDIAQTAQKTFGLQYLIEGASEAFDLPGKTAAWNRINFSLNP